MTQTSTTVKDAAVGTPPPQQQPPNFWRWAARAFLSLWWLFVVALGSGIASSLGTHAAPALLPFVPKVLSWLQTSSLIVKIGIGLLVLAVLSLMGWLTSLAWKQRQEQQAEETEKDLERQTAAFTKVMETDVNPRLDTGVLRHFDDRRLGSG